VPGSCDGLKVERGLSTPLAEPNPMVPAVHKITLSSSRDIPFNKLLISQSNVRRIKAGVSIKMLAEDIERLSQSDSKEPHVIHRMLTPSFRSYTRRWLLI
jgi:hypothetical protein